MCSYNQVQADYFPITACSEMIFPPYSLAIFQKVTKNNTSYFHHKSTSGYYWYSRSEDFRLSPRVSESDRLHRRSTRVRIRCTMGRAMYSDSAMVSCRPRSVELACRSSSCSLLFLTRLGSPHSRLCNEDAEGRKQGWTAEPVSGVTRSVLLLAYTVANHRLYVLKWSDDIWKRV